MSVVDGLGDFIKTALRTIAQAWFAILLAILAFVLAIALGISLFLQRRINRLLRLACVLFWVISLARLCAVLFDRFTGEGQLLSGAAVLLVAGSVTMAGLSVMARGQNWTHALILSALVAWGVTGLISLLTTPLLLLLPLTPLLIFAPISISLRKEVTHE